MDVSELRTLYRHQADDKLAEFRLDDTEFLFFLNEAHRKASRNANLIFDKSSAFTTIAIIANQAKYTLDTSIYAIVDAILTEQDGTITQLTVTDRIELDRVYDKWREKIETPVFLINNGKTFELIPTPDADCSLKIEVYRYPVTLALDADIPEIQDEHHEHLIDWVLYRAFNTKDADSMDERKAAEAKDNFLKYFGQEPRAITRKNQYSNKPHHNKAVI